ncbi:MAG: threonine/serine dehydratase [Cyanobacteria bacterium HKST-UBA01]|nr:threonine/serine dehydratase [Cyanobacteria bacterium HKST-UBA01]
MKPRPTLVFESRKLSRFLGFSFLVASETFQHTGSFKFRAAMNTVLNSNAEHLVTISSGNFGQALAAACESEGRKCTVLMPATSARVKVEAVKSFGARAELVDVTAKTRNQWLEDFIAAKQVAGENKIEVVSPFDDDRVIEGNSSLVDDLVPYSDRFDTILVPVGGGGLASGVVQGLQRNSLSCTVYGVEPSIADDAARSLKEGRLVANETEPMTIADGVRTLSLGERNWKILKDGLDAVLTVEEKEIEEAVRLYYELANLKVEPSGALSLAALKKYKATELLSDKKPLVIVSGGNVDASIYAELIG